jgi:hypothetical protein
MEMSGRKKRTPWEELREAVAEGYRRLAFGPVGDVVRLMMAEEGEAINYGELDLFGVAEMKRGKGTMEVKLASRLEALDRLAQLCREEHGGGEDAFYKALSQGARELYHREGERDGTKTEG